MLVECGRRGKKGKPGKKGDNNAEDKAGDQPKLGYKEKKKLAKEVSHELYIHQCLAASPVQTTICQAMSQIGIIAIMLCNCTFGIDLPRTGCVMLHLLFLSSGTSNK